MLSWTSPLRAPSACRLPRFLRFIQPAVRRVIARTAAAGASAASPSRRLSESRKTPAPIITMTFAANWTSACEKNWFSLSVSLLIREIRSPALFWLKNSSGRSCSLVNSVFRRLNSTKRPTRPICCACT